MAHGALADWDGNCSYVCDSGFFFADGACSSCSLMPSCPIGFYLDNAACLAGASQERPVCRPCSGTALWAFVPGPWRCLTMSCGDSPNSAAARRQRVVAHPWRHVDVRLQRLVPRALPHSGQAQRRLCPRRPPRLSPELHPLRRQRRPHVRRRLRPGALLSKSVSRPNCTL